MSNGNAKKYFGVFDKNYNIRNYSGDTVERAIDNLHRNVAQNANNPNSHKQTTYIPPIPEKTLPHKKEDSLDDVIKKVNKIPSQSSPSHPTSKSTSSDSSYTKPNPFKYLGDRIMSDIKETMVPDPRDSAYVFLRRIAPVVLGKPSNGFEEKLEDMAASIFYKFIHDYLSKK